VRVLVTVGDKSRGEAHAREVLERAQVYEVGRDPSLSSGSASDAGDTSRGSIASVTLAVTAEQARVLAEARRSGELDVLLLPPQEIPRP
jgi:Flp pilus assembly protein CpaB